MNHPRRVSEPSFCKKITLIVYIDWSHTSESRDKFILSLLHYDSRETKEN